MGALHEGHLALIRAARAENDLVVVSIFVNPTQFNAAEDLKKYPRDLARDLALAEGAGADLVFAPGGGRDVPARGFHLGGRGGSDRRPVRRRAPGPLPGRLHGGQPSSSTSWGRTAPTSARRMRSNWPSSRGWSATSTCALQIVPCPTVREADGLAMSSRNVRLSPEARAQAPVLYRALTAARVAVENGERDAERLKAGICATLADADLATVDYVEIVDAETLEPVSVIDRPCLIALAVLFGRVRLIDNVTLR